MDTLSNGILMQMSQKRMDSLSPHLLLLPPLSPFLAIVISNAFVCENIKILFAEIYASKRLLYYKIEWLRFDICGAIEKPDWLKWNA